MATRRTRTEPLPSPPDGLPLRPPVEPMLAKMLEGIPRTGGPFLFEPKWDGFRALFFRDGDRCYLQSRDLRPLGRYFPEVVGALSAQLPARCVVDGEIVIAARGALHFDALQLRLHPAASRVAKLSREQPASFVAFDLLWVDDMDLRSASTAQRREALERVMGAVHPPVYLTPATRDSALAAEWFQRFEGAGLDGVMAKPMSAPYQPGKRAMFKVKHARTADCVVAGFRWHKNGEGTLVGSLLLGLYDADGVLQHVGVTASFTAAERKALVVELDPLRRDALEGHPWRAWASAEHGRMPGMQSRWSAGKDLSWEPLRVERVCEVKYDHLQGDRFRHGTTFLRWRADKRPEGCRYEQLEVTPPYELERIFGASAEAHAGSTGGPVGADASALPGSKPEPR